jgi:hypothetical protein
VVAGLTLESIKTMPKSAVLNKLAARLNELAPGSTPQAKDARKGYMADALGVDGWTRVEVLGLTELRAGLWRLVEVGRAPEAPADDDVPLEADLDATQAEAPAPHDLGLWGPLHRRAERAGLSEEAWGELWEGYTYEDALAVIEGAEAERGQP